MQKLNPILLLILICVTLQGYTQSSSFWVPLQKQPRETPYTLLSNRIYEIEDISGFKIPEGIDNFVIGYLKLSEFHDRYYERHLNEANLLRYQSIVEKHQIDTIQFAYNNLKYTKLHVLLYMQNGVKHLIIDTDFDHSFLNEQVHRGSKFKEIIEDPEDRDFVFTELKLPMDSFQIPILKVIPVNILMNETRYPEDKIGNNDSLQVYITQSFEYQGYFIVDTDTVFLNMDPQYFDLFYYNRLHLYYYCKSYQTKYALLRLGQQLKLKNRIYLFEEFDPINKRVKLTRLADDIFEETKPGNFLIPLPGLDSLNGYTLVFFTGSWCGPCKPVLDSLLIFYKQYPQINIISVNQESDTMKFIKHVEDYKIPWKIIYDKTGTGGIGGSHYLTTYNLQSVPHLFFINPKRRILRMESGRTNCINLLKEIKEKGCETFEIFE